MQTEDSTTIRVTGTMIGHLYVCPRELWFFQNHIEMEHTSDLVSMGKLLHEESYSREKRKERPIDDRNLIRLIRLECYKLIKHLTGMETYQAFRAWW